jgi:hypothetical protein
MPKSAPFFKAMGSLIKEAAKAGRKAHPRVAIFGERASLLWEDGKADAAIRLEQLCNQLEVTCEVDILCGYKMSGHHGEEDNQDFKSICAEHSAIYSQAK